MNRIWRCSQGEGCVHLGNLKIASSLLANYMVLLTLPIQDLQQALGWFAAKCQVARIRVRTSKSEAMVVCINRWIAPFCLGWVSALSRGVKVSQDLNHDQWENRTSDEQAVWWSICGTATIVVKKGAEPKGEALDLLFHLCSNHHLWFWALGSGWYNDVLDTSSWKCFSLHGGWDQP